MPTTPTARTPPTAIPHHEPDPAHRTAPAVFIHPHPLVPAKMSILRLQLAHHQNHAGRRRIRTSPAHGFTARTAPFLGTRHRNHIYRRRHAQRVFRIGHRPAAQRHPCFGQTESRSRNHAGSQSRYVRPRQIPRLPQYRHQPPVHRRAEFRRPQTRRAGAHPLGRRSPYRHRKSLPHF